MIGYTVKAMINLAKLSIILLLSAVTAKAQIPQKGTVTDNDGNVYLTVVIDKYEWMAQNLRTTTYRDGKPIPQITVSSDWTLLSSGAYCLYDNYDSNARTCGALYNWFAVLTGTLCPDGWRVPSDDEWKSLESFADSRNGVDNPVWNTQGMRGFDAARRLKTTAGWKFDGNGTDRFGFSALPCGERLSRNGQFFIKNCNGFWWSSTSYDDNRAYYRSIIYSFEEIMRFHHDKRFGFSIRCLRDN